MHEQLPGSVSALSPQRRLRFKGREPGCVYQETRLFRDLLLRNELKDLE